MNLKDILLKLIKDKDENDKIYDSFRNLNYKGKKEDIEKFTYDYEFTSANLDLLKNTFLDKLDETNKIFDAIQKIPGKENYTYSDCLYDAFQKYKSHFDIKAKFPNNHDLTEEKVKELIGNNENSFNTFKKYVRKIKLDFIKDNISTVENNLFDEFESVLSDDEKKELLNTYEKNKLTRDNYIVTEVQNEKEINELIDNNINDTNLEYIKEFVLTNATNSSKDLMSNIAEKFGMFSDKYIEQIGDEELKNFKYKDLFNKENNQVKKNKKLTNKDYKDIVDELEIENYKLVDSDKNAIIECLKTIDSFNNVETGGPLLDETYKCEEGTKLYGFKNFDILRNKIDKAIKEKNVDELDKLAKLHKEESKKMDKLISMVDKLNVKIIPQNVSIARTNTLSSKYTKEIKNSTIINALWHNLYYIKKTNTPIEEFVNSPMKAIMAHEALAENDYSIKKHSFDGDINFVKNVLDKKKERDEMDEWIADFQFIRQMTPYTHFFENTQLHNAMVDRVFSLSIKEKVSDNLRLLKSEYFKDNVKETAKNIALAPFIIDEVTGMLTKDYKTLSASYFHEENLITGEKYKRFDREKVLREGNFNPKEVIDTFKAFEETKDIPKKIKDEFIKGHNELAADILKAKDLSYSKDFGYLCERGEVNPIDAFKANAKNRDISRYCLNKINECKNDLEMPLDRKLYTTLNALKALNEKYNRRSSFGKFFRPMAHREKNAVTNIKATLIEMNVSEEKINDILNGNQKIEDFVKDKKIVPNKEHFVIPDKEFNLNRASLMRENQNDLSIGLEKEQDLKI